jgi:transposase
LKLYLYGYTQGVRSSRRLEAECGRNLEVQWLLQQLRPDFKTIADFRKDNRAAFQNVLRVFTALGQDLDLFGGELLAVDGTKIKAVNSPGRNFSQTKLRQRLQALEQRIEQYLELLDQSDAAEATPVPAPGAGTLAQWREKLAQLQQSQTKCRERLAELTQAGATQVSLTDPDSRALGRGARAVVGSNVQTVVDAKHKLIVTSAVTNAVNDLGQLAPQALAAQQQLGVAQAKVVADTGYYKSEDIKTCQDAGLEPYVARGRMSPSERQGLYQSGGGYRLL